MLNNLHFYHRTIRRNVIAFGNMFKNIQLVRYEKDTYNEIDRVTVPLTYTGKETFIKRLYSNSDLHKQIQILLPKMSFKMTDISYDPSRKISSYMSSFAAVAGSSTNVAQQYAGTPYDLTFELYLYVRNVEDGTQIIEQILPYFNPDYTLTMSFVDSMNITRDVPIVLESVQNDIENEGDSETVRIITWTLRFKMKTYFFGPVSTDKKYIKNVTANTHYEEQNYFGKVELTLSPGPGQFQLNEIVYQGYSPHDKNAVADVLAWDNVNNKLLVTHIRGAFDTNNPVKGLSNNTTRSITSIYPDKYIQVSVNVTTANPNAQLFDDFGYSTEINYEYPTNG